MIMVMKLDPDGLPRAYGVADNESDAKEIADDMLQKYRAKKFESGDMYLAKAKYTEKVEELEDSNADSSRT